MIRTALLLAALAVAALILSALAVKIAMPVFLLAVLGALLWHQQPEATEAALDNLIAFTRVVIRKLKGRRS